MAVTSIESSDGKGYGAGVDGGRRLHVFNCPSNTVFATLSPVVAALPGATQIAASRSNCCSVIVQNQGMVALVLRFDSANPAAGDFLLAAGATFALPCPFDGPVNASGVGGAGVAVVLQMAR